MHVQWPCVIVWLRARQCDALLSTRCVVPWYACVSVWHRHAGLVLLFACLCLAFSALLAHGVRQAIMHIVGTTMDFVEDELASEFVFHNPNAKARAPCIHSSVFPPVLRCFATAACVVVVVD